LQKERGKHHSSGLKKGARRVLLGKRKGGKNLSAFEIRKCLKRLSFQFLLVIGEEEGRRSTQ